MQIYLIKLSSTHEADAFKGIDDNAKVEGDLRRVGRSWRRRRQISEAVLEDHDEADQRQEVGKGGEEWQLLEVAYHEVRHEGRQHESLVTLHRPTERWMVFFHDLRDKRQKKCKL